MIVVLRSCKAAARVAAATGGSQLPREYLDRKTGAVVTVPGLRVDLGDVDLAGFEGFRAAVEQAAGPMFVLRAGPEEDSPVLDNGWFFTGAKFEVEVTAPEQLQKIVSHFGARRFAFNRAIGAVKANLDARKRAREKGQPLPGSLSWSFRSFRDTWNAEKRDVAPWWWHVNSKEAYNAGFQDAADALDSWKKSKAGDRAGKPVGFPDFQSRRRGDPERVRFTTGAMRLEADRRTIVLPVIGKVRSAENTRRVQRHLASGRGHLLSVTLSRRWNGRLFVAVDYALRTPSTPVQPAKPSVTAGVDLGLRCLATVADSEGKVFEVANPAPLRATMDERRRTARGMSRKIPGSRAHTAAKAKLAVLDRRAVHVRQEAMHQLTTRLTREYGTVVIEDLDIAALKKSMGRRAFRRSVSDAALGAFRPTLDYKSARTGTVVVVADRWFPSSQIHHACGCRLAAKHKLDKLVACAVTGEMVDRDVNAAKNLRNWPDSQRGPVGATDPRERAAAAA